MKSFWNYKALYATSVVLMLCISCYQDKEEAYTPPTEANVPIVFSSSDYKTKGLDELNYSSIKESRFGVFAYIGENNIYLQNRNVEYLSSSGKINEWHCSPAAYWPFNTSLNFFAYAPYQEKVHRGENDTENPTILFPAEDYVSGLPRIRVTPSTNVTYQPDFCIATPCFDKAPGSKIHMEFHHVLTKVKFFLNLTGAETPLYHYRISSLTIRGIETSNILTYVDNADKPYKWDKISLSPKTGEYQLLETEGHLTRDTIKFVKALPDNAPVEERYTQVNSLVNGRLYLIPQTLTSSAEIELVISVYIRNSNDLVTMLPPFIFSLPENSVWEEEKTVAYMATIDIKNIKESALEVKIENWTDSENTHPTEKLE